MHSACQRAATRSERPDEVGAARALDEVGVALGAARGDGRDAPGVAVYRKGGGVQAHARTRGARVHRARTFAGANH